MNFLRFSELITKGWVGFSFVSAFCWLQLHIKGEYPSQELAVAYAVFTITVYCLLMSTKSKVETLKDILFVLVGTSAFLLIDMEFVINKLVLWTWGVLTLGLVFSLRGPHE